MRRTLSSVKSLSSRLAWLLLLTAATIATHFGGQSAQAENRTPRDDAGLSDRMAELRATYAPYLRSLPKKVDPRPCQMLCGDDWLGKYEIERAEDGRRPQPPAWFGANVDDSTWKKTTVPEWQCIPAEGRVPISCIYWYRKTFKADPPAKGKRVFLVFEGVDWEAEVWLNGRKLGSHSVYFEPFRFDVTGILQENNTLAVRVIDGPKFGEPAAYWTLFPIPPANETRYVRDRAKSLDGIRNGDNHMGSGFGIHREVYLETTGPAVVDELLARGRPEAEQSELSIKTDASTASKMTLQWRIMPENFEGRSYSGKLYIDVPKGTGRFRVTAEMPQAQAWSPETPYLHRCRATLKDGDRVVDSRDALFGYRSFSMVSKGNPREGVRPGTLLLNDEPIFIRGTNIQGLNALWYWSENDRLRDIVLLLKAGNFNAVRSCQHVMYPEVREILDRLGMMSEQDVGSRHPNLGEQTRGELIHAAEVIARQCYNNPGVVLVSYANETHFDPTDMLRASLAVDPDRIIAPISGDPFKTGKPAEERENYDLPEEMWKNVIGDFHTYRGWYGWAGRLWELCYQLEPGRRVIVGEYGAEGLDGYETMKRYPKQWEPVPPKTADTLWGHVQTKKDDRKQIAGFRGRRPRNLGQYIKASQNYQADVLSEVTKGWRLSPRRLAGYFQFHFIDVLPANWPKSIVSHDLVPKPGYYEMAQLNQPLVPLPKLTNRGKTMQLWLANDLNRPIENHRIVFSITHDGNTLLKGDQPAAVPPRDAVEVADVDLASLSDEADVVRISLSLRDAKGKEVSRYSREVFIDSWRLREDSLKLAE